jgi:uncharacterized protein YaaW (UPF0174 family)
MSKGKRLKGKRLKGRGKRSGKGFVAEFSDRLTANFQQEIRNSELWDQMVEEFGEKRAKELLKDIKADIKPGLAPDGSGDRTEDIS